MTFTHPVHVMNAFCVFDTTEVNYTVTDGNWTELGLTHRKKNRRTQTEQNPRNFKNLNLNRSIKYEEREL